MKYKHILAFLFLGIISFLLLSFFVNFVSADIVNVNPQTGEADVLGINPASVPQSPEDVANVSATYLKQEWSKIMQNSSAGRVFLTIGKGFSFLDFFWKPVLGIPFTFSWAFFFSICIFLFFILILSPIMATVLGGGFFGFLSGLIIASLIGMSGIIKKAVDLLSFALNNQWIATGAFIVAVLLVILGEKIGGNISAAIRKSKEVEEKDKTKKAGKIVQVGAQIVKKEFE